MNLNIIRHGDVAVATVPGKYLDNENVTGFERAISTAIRDNTSLVVDMNQLAYINSLGLGALVFGLRKMQEKGGDLKLAGLRGEVREMFEFVRMNTIFDIHETPEDAIAAFSKSYPRA